MPHFETKGVQMLVLFFNLPLLYRIN